MKKILSGYASIDKPWLDKYPEFLFAQRKYYRSINENLREVWADKDKCIINYYDNQIKAGKFFERVDDVAKSLYALGVKEGDAIITSLESVPEFLQLFLACELVGCNIRNYTDEIRDGVGLIRESGAKLFFCHDYISRRDIELIYEKTYVNKAILIEPFFSVVDKKGLRNNIISNVETIYRKYEPNSENELLWSEFLTEGKNITEIPVPKKENVLFVAYTSGTTGMPKAVLHTSATLLGVVRQLALFPSHEKNEIDTWLLTILPPTLVAVVVAMMIYPLADGKQLILDPFCRLEDLDIEMMHYKPNCWGLIPIFFDTLLDSKRIPDDYDMSYFKLFGFGAEPMTKRFIARVQDFLDKHNCKAPFSSGYGQSEGGSDFTVCIGKEMIASGSAGIPLIDTTIAIFEEGTTKELTYGQVGEVCKAGPGIMVGYSDSQMTKKVLKVHADGTTWLHTGDYGFMSPEGLLFVMGRQGIKVYPDKIVYPLAIENKILSYAGIKEAIVVAGKDNTNVGYEVPYLFVVPLDEMKEHLVVHEVMEHAKKVLLREEYPHDVFAIKKKPIAHFKTDRKYLQQKYGLL